MIAAVKWLMTVATLLFALGWRERRRDLQRHRWLMSAGLLFFLGIAVVLVLGVHVFGQTYGPAAWCAEAFGPAGAKRLLVAHRAVASVSGALLLAQGYSGWRRRPFHPRLGTTTYSCWMISYVSGLFLFV